MWHAFELQAIVAEKFHQTYSDYWLTTVPLVRVCTSTHCRFAYYILYVCEYTPPLPLRLSAFRLAKLKPQKFVVLSPSALFKVDTNPFCFTVLCAIKYTCIGICFLRIALLYLLFYYYRLRNVARGRERESCCWDLRNLSATRRSSAIENESRNWK